MDPEVKIDASAEPGKSQGGARTSRGGKSRIIIPHQNIVQQRERIHNEIDPIERTLLTLVKHLRKYDSLDADAQANDYRNIDGLTSMNMKLFAAAIAIMVDNKIPSWEVFLKSYQGYFETQQAEKYLDNIMSSTFGKLTEIKKKAYTMKHIVSLTLYLKKVLEYRESRIPIKQTQNYVSQLGLDRQISEEEESDSDSSESEPPSPVKQPDQDEDEERTYEQGSDSDSD